MPKASRKVLASIGLIAVYATASGTIPTWSQVASDKQSQAGAVSPAQPQPAPYIEEIKKTVVFITGKFEREAAVTQMDGTSKRQAVEQSISGTGYLVQIPGADPALQESVLVTNRHMIREPGPTGVLGQGPYLKSVSIRINTKMIQADGSGTETFDVPILNVGGEMLCYMDSADTDVDLAICPVTLNVEKWDFRTIPLSMFLTDAFIKSENINESDDVVFAGLFAPFRGKNRNFPVVRHGKVAMIASERIPIDDVHTADLYLADVMSFGGNSGSPVIVMTGNGHDGSFGPSRLFLMGTMQGYFQVNAPVAVQTAVSQGIALENTGVASVVPAKKIVDTLNTPEQQYCSNARLGQYYESVKNFPTALASYQKNLLSNLPPEQYDWCARATYLGNQRVETSLSIKAKTAMPPKYLVNQIPILWWLNSLKSAVVVLPTGQTLATPADQYLMVGADDSSYYVWKSTDPDPRGTVITFPKNAYTATYTQ